MSKDQVKLPDELVKALEGGKWEGKGYEWSKNAMVLKLTPSPSVFGSWRWEIILTDRNETQVHYGVTKSLSEFVRFGV